MTAHLPRQTMRFNDVRPQNARLEAEIAAAIRAVIADGRFELGKEVDEFEQAFATYIGVRYAVGVHSGTAALHLALRAFGVGQGDEVITVANSDPSTVAATRFAGARPVLVDIEPHSFNIDPGR